MKKTLICALFALVSMNVFAGNAFDFRLTSVECSGVPDFIQLKVNAVDAHGSFKGQGIENYLNFGLTCKMSEARDQILCSSPQRVSAKIVIENNLITASFKGVYHPEVKIGCIGSM